MGATEASSIVFAFVFGGAMLGMFLRPVLPPHHLRAGSKDIIRLGMGLIATMAALVLGLLVASAKEFYDSQSNEVTQIAANVIFLDRELAHYGPESQEARDQLRRVLIRIRNRVWPTDGSRPAGLEPVSVNETIYSKIQQLKPKDDAQRTLQNRALTMAASLLQSRWLMYEQSTSPIPFPMLMILVLWLTIIFVSFGLFAPRNVTVLVTLFVSALSVSCAIFLILEMYKPFQGIIRISGAPLTAALAHLGK
jgi:hypothetical protein